MSQSNFTGRERARRKLFLKTAGIPESEPWCIRIPPNDDMNGFSRLSYHENYCRGYISKIEFDEIIDNVCKLASLAYSKKRQNDNKQLSPKVILIFWL